MNHCQLPIIDFKKYKKQNKIYKLKVMTKINPENNNKISTLLSNYNFSIYNNNNFDDINSNKDYISLHFFLSNKSLEEYSYIIITTLNELFSEVTKKLFKTAPFLKKENIKEYMLQDNDKMKLLEINKTNKENELRDGSQIIIQFK